MSSEGSSSAGKWIIGCGVAAFLGIVICAGGLFFAVRSGIQTARNAARQAMQAAQEAQREMAEQAEAAQFAAAWIPPAPGATSDVLFPENISGWGRTNQDDATEVAELGLSRAGKHAVYESGIDGIDVYVYEVGADEQSAVFQSAADAIDAGSYTTRSKFSVDDGNVHRMTFSISPPERYGLMWWCKGWLLVFIADDAEVDLTNFQREYATSIQGAQTSAETTPATPAADGAAPTIEESAPEASPGQPAAEQDGNPAPGR
jgi:hypothetical protein